MSEVQEGDLALPTHLVDRVDELSPAYPLRVVHVKGEEVLPEQLAAVGPREAAAERLHRTGQLLVCVSVEVEFLRTHTQFVWFGLVRFGVAMPRLRPFFVANTRRFASKRGAATAEGTCYTRAMPRLSQIFVEVRPNMFERLVKARHHLALTAAFILLR